MTAAVAMESLLNDAIVTQCYSVFPKGDYKGIAESYLSMSLKGKLISVVPLASKNEYLIDKESDLFQTLKNLISLRNEVAHTKSFFEDVEYEEIEEEFEGELREGMGLDINWMAKRFSKAIYSSSIEDVEKCINAVGELKSCLLNYGEEEFNGNFEFIKKAKS